MALLFILIVIFSSGPFPLILLDVCGDVSVTRCITWLVSHHPHYNYNPLQSASSAPGPGSVCLPSPFMDVIHEEHRFEIERTAVTTLGTLSAKTGVANAKIDRIKYTPTRHRRLSSLGHKYFQHIRRCITIHQFKIILVGIIRSSFVLLLLLLLLCI